MVKLSRAIAPALIACAAAGWLAVAAQPAQAATAPTTAAAPISQPSHIGPDGYAWPSESRYDYRPAYRVGPIHRFPGYRHTRWFNGRYYYQTRTGWHCLHHGYRH